MHIQREIPVAAGKSSFELIDQDRFFSYIEIASITKFIDLGSGVGNYSLEIAKKLEKGKLYAVDLWEEGIEILKKRANESGINNITTLVADIRKPLPFDSETFDGCLMATIIHDINEKKRLFSIKEAKRILKRNGILYIVEFKKIPNGPGPDFRIRIDRKALVEIVQSCGFDLISYGDIGRFNYIAKFQKLG